MQRQNIRNIGLARALSKLGFCSRSQAVELIRCGKVSLNGRIRLDPEAPVHLEKDRIEVNGKAVTAKPKIYLMLNKPRGVVTSASDEKGRETVYRFLKQEVSWVAPVGRLDKASEGLLLLTNDSEWSARVLAPETHLEKTYHVQIGKIAYTALLDSLMKGVRATEGDFLRARHVAVLRSGSRNSWLEIVLDEGKNRHIRRMLAEFDLEILRLVRVAIGPLALGNLRKGEIRSLTKEEKQAIDSAMFRTRSGKKLQQLG